MVFDTLRAGSGCEERAWQTTGIQDRMQGRTRGACQSRQASDLAGISGSGGGAGAW